MPKARPLAVGGWILAILVLVVGARNLAAGRVLALHPGRGGAIWNVYDDRSKGGGSSVEVLRASDTLSLKVSLGPKDDAYWGAEWNPRGAGRWKLQETDSVVIWARAAHARRATLFLCSVDPAMTRLGDPLSRRYLSAPLPLDGNWSRRSLALADLEPPSWWLALHPTLPDPGRKLLDQVVALQIGPGTNAGAAPDTLEIARIEIVPVARAAWIWFVAAVVLAASGAAAWRSGRSGSAVVPTSLAAGSALPKPVPLETPAPDLERLLGFLAANYQREELDLATVSRETLIPAKKVTALLRSRDDTFRSVLNRLRLEEARRLLAETDLQASEIAFKVGYGNPSHFHRQFREAFGNTPLALRAELQNPPKD